MPSGMKKKELTLKLAEDTGATLVRIIGNIAILFKESDDPEKRRIFIDRLK